jgi:hypothetical protein
VSAVAPAGWHFENVLVDGLLANHIGIAEEHVVRPRVLRINVNDQGFADAMRALLDLRDEIVAERAKPQPAERCVCERMCKP